MFTVRVVHFREVINRWRDNVIISCAMGRKNCVLYVFINRECFGGTAVLVCTLGRNVRTFRSSYLYHNGCYVSAQSGAPVDMFIHFFMPLLKDRR